MCYLLYFFFFQWTFESMSLPFLFKLYLLSIAFNNNCVFNSNSLNDIFIFFSFLQDLVKSHLMFAVREEVEVLKEKISELMDRINQLEVENTILKANASQETLTKLTTAAPTKTTHTATNSNPSNGPIS